MACSLACLRSVISNQNQLSPIHEIYNTRKTNGQHVSPTSPASCHPMPAWPRPAPVHTAMHGSLETRPLCWLAHKLSCFYAAKHHTYITTVAASSPHVSPITASCQSLPYLARSCSSMLARNRATSLHPTIVASLRTSINHPSSCHG